MRSPRGRTGLCCQHECDTGHVVQRASPAGTSSVPGDHPQMRYATQHMSRGPWQGRGTQALAPTDAPVIARCCMESHALPSHLLPDSRAVITGTLAVAAEWHFTRVATTLQVHICKSVGHYIFSRCCYSSIRSKTVSRVLKCVLHFPKIVQYLHLDDMSGQLFSLTGLNVF